MQYRLLIVDDEPAIRSTLCTILQVEGFAVETASSGQSAKDALASGTFDAVITDISMETPTAGYEVIEAAGRQNPRPATILMSAYSAFRDDWKAHGAQAFFEKPMLISELVDRVKELLADGRDRPAA
jgi:DNA-binding NtrC family response regulator